MTILGDVDIVLDTHTTDIPVALQDAGIDVLARLRIIEHRVDNEAAEIDLKKMLAQCIIRWEQGKAKGYQHTPGSTVITEPAGKVPLTRR